MLNMCHGAAEFYIDYMHVMSDGSSKTDVIHTYEWYFYYQSLAIIKIIQIKFIEMLEY